jgi:hypothetical protein
MIRIGAILRSLWNLLGAFFAVWIIVWFVKFLFTSRYAWIGWLAIVYTIIRVNWFPEPFYESESGLFD